MRAAKPIPLPLDAETHARFWANVDKNGPVCSFYPELGECWLWTGRVGKTDRYGKFAMKASDGRRRTYQAHRVSHAIERGVLALELKDHHLCEVRRCVRPSHLQEVTDRVNILRGRGPSAINIRKSHCPRGHALSGSNLRIAKDGSRRCRECDRLFDAKRVHKPKPRNALLTCAHCGIEFLGTKDQARSARLGRRNFCSLVHAGFQFYAERGELLKEGRMRFVAKRVSR